jgi:hypothetical protein
MRQKGRKGRNGVKEEKEEKYIDNRNRYPYPDPYPCAD